MKYTLDRIEDGQCVFLRRPEEEVELIIPENELLVAVKEGDIVFIESDNGDYRIQVLKEETENVKEKVSSLIEKLKSKNI